MAATILEVSDLSVSFGELAVISNLSFEAPRGASLAAIGPNGVGKTVLFQALIGSVPYKGSIAWEPGVRLGYVPQKLDIDRDIPMTGMDFLRARASLARSSAADIEEKIGLAGVARSAAERRIGTLSGGQFQRLLIAFALLGNPNVLLLDEPTSGVDEPGQRRLNELLEMLRKECDLTVLFISHELSVVYRYATHVLCLGRGHACFGIPKAILTPELLEQIYDSPVDYHVHDH